MQRIQSYDTTDTICAIATPEGIGAIGVIRISGPEAIQQVQACFVGKDLTQQPGHTAHFGKIQDGTRLIDEVLATVFRAPRSYTGEDTVEISCHGSPYILQHVMQTLLQNGCRAAQPGEFTLRAFLNKKLDLSQAEAVADLIASNSEANHQSAMMHMRGGFSKQIADMRERLINFASLIELELDFAEEDVEFAKRPELIALVSNLMEVIQSLTQTFAYGNAIKQGIPTVIVGKPNAGKSTLLNALLNEERAIVSDIAGTTRDTIEEVFVIDGIAFRLIDTAGIREHAADSIEEIGIERTLDKIAQASIVIYLFDAAHTPEQAWRADIAKLSQQKNVVIPVANKVDVANHFSAMDVMGISAKTQQGMDALRNKIVSTVRHDAIANDVIITNVRHYEALRQAHEALQQVLNGIDMRQSGELLAFDIRKALFHLGEITGEVTTDDLLANIFSKFCIGK
jgi:tRNA modification GTPase